MRSREIRLLPTPPLLRSSTPPGVEAGAKRVPFSGSAFSLPGWHAGGTLDQTPPRRREREENDSMAFWNSSFEKSGQSVSVTYSSA
jgi:hypothetical protein